MDKYLIINADDFGMCHAQNEAIMDLFKDGCITSSTIMAPCPWAKEAAVFAAGNKELDIGVHFTTTAEWHLYRWAPVNSANTASLRDPEGYMWAESEDFAANADVSQAMGELEAQILKLKSFGVEPVHADNHMGSLYGIYNGNFDFLTSTIMLCSKHGLPFRLPSGINDAQLDNKMLEIGIPASKVKELLGAMAAFANENGVALPDHLWPGDWNGDQSKSFENYREYIYELYRSFEPGVTETYIHPAVESDELKGITDSWQRRVWEYRLFMDPATKQHIKSLGIELINYRQLKKMRGF